MSKCNLQISNLYSDELDLHSLCLCKVHLQADQGKVPIQLIKSQQRSFRVKWKDPQIIAYYGNLRNPRPLSSFFQLVLSLLHYFKSLRIPTETSSLPLKIESTVSQKTNINNNNLKQQ